MAAAPPRGGPGDRDRRRLLRQPALGGEGGGGRGRRRHRHPRRRCRPEGGQGDRAGATRGLAERDLEAPLREAIARGTPYLGICLGLQVLFDESEEQGPQRGLGLVAGRVVRFRPADHALKVPHMGWNQVRRVAADPVGDAVADGAHLYFVHSYHVVPADPAVTVMTSEHGVVFAAAIRRDNVFAVQFHPEKSQRTGLALLEAFVRT